MKATSSIDPTLKQWATPRERQYIKAIEKHGSMRAAARALGVQFFSVAGGMKALAKRAAVAGYSPEHQMTRPVPAPYVVKGVSTYWNKDGKPTGQWVKSQLDAQQYAEMLREAVRAFLAPTRPLRAPPGPERPQGDIIPWIQIGDAHIGMLAQADEVGENFDLKIAEAELVAAICRLIDELPPSERIVINDLGDATHYENWSATTEASGHVLDFDSRFPKMIRTYSRVLRAVIDKALTKAQHVDVIINQGNHSRTNDVWAAELLRVAYGATGRVHVLNNDSVFLAYRMGNTLVMTHHSDKCKPKNLIGVMTTDFRKDFGETEFHYIDVGHVHHRSVAAEHPSIVIESWNNLAPGDRWAHDNGYRARRSISVVLRSKTYGEVGRRLMHAQEVRDILAAAGKGRAVKPKEAFTV